MDKMKVEGVELVLAHPDEYKVNWVGKEELKRQLKAAWLMLSEDDLPLNPRVIGMPGIGKTTLAYAVAKEVVDNVYIFQCTVDTRPDDLIIAPVVGCEQNIVYHASSLVTAMLTGGICILDEANRMGEKSWASLAPLLDNRRYVESVAAGIKIKAHPEFRIAVTMNEDASTFDVPDYIQSRLQPKVEIGFPEIEEEKEILKANFPDADEDLIKLTSDFLQRAHNNRQPFTTRDGVNIARYAIKLIHMEKITVEKALEQSVTQTLGDTALRFLRKELPSPRKLFGMDIGFTLQDGEEITDIDIDYLEEDTDDLTDKE